MQSIPSADLNAALVDIQFGGSSGDHSAEYPFSLAELELFQQQMDLQQQQQQQMQMQAGGAHLDFMDAPALPLAGGMMLGGVVDAAPFLADNGMSFSQLGSNRQPTTNKKSNQPTNQPTDHQVTKQLASQPASQLTFSCICFVLAAPWISSVRLRL